MKLFSVQHDSRENILFYSEYLKNGYYLRYLYYFLVQLILVIPHLGFVSLLQVPIKMCKNDKTIKLSVKLSSVLYSSPDFIESQIQCSCDTCRNLRFQFLDFIQIQQFSTKHLQRKFEMQCTFDRF